MSLLAAKRLATANYETPTRIVYWFPVLSCNWSYGGCNSVS